ncbi:MAG: lipocalin-like domain-containing protein, partial [Ferruginibacter sp.]
SCGCMVHSGQSSIKKFRGMWKLDQFQVQDSITKNWIPDPTRIGYSGYILYDGLGNMAVQQFPPGYHDFDPDKNIDSLDKEALKKVARLYRSNYTYIGRYEISKTMITHKRLSATNPKDWGTALQRDFNFSGDTLILTTVEKINGGGLRIRWVKF